MNGFVFMILLAIVFIVSMLMVISTVKGKRVVYITAITATLFAWFVGLVLDANIGFGDPAGFLSFRILLPILAMGLCILHAIMESKD